MGVCVHSFKKKKKPLPKVRVEGVIWPGYKCVCRIDEINNYTELHEPHRSVCISVFLTTLQSIYGQGP